MTIKLALLDVDGTLRDDHDWIPGARELMRRLGEAGVPVSLSSGRTSHSLHELAEDVPEVTFVVASGGAVIEERTDDGWHSLAGHRLPTFVVQEVIRESRDAGIELWLFSADAWYVENETETVRWDAAVTGSEWTVADLAAVTRPIVKMAILPKDDQERAYAYSLTSHEGLAVVQSHPRIIDLVPDNAMRFKGGDAIVGHLGILWGDTMAIGDGENDLGMLGAAGTSFLMDPLRVDRLPEQLKERGTYTEVTDLQQVLDALDDTLAAETRPLLPRLF